MAPYIAGDTGSPTPSDPPPTQPPRFVEQEDPPLVSETPPPQAPSILTFQPIADEQLEDDPPPTDTPNGEPSDGSTTAPDPPEPDSNTQQPDEPSVGGTGNSEPAGNPTTDVDGGNAGTPPGELPPTHHLTMSCVVNSLFQKRLCQMGWDDRMLIT